MRALLVATVSGLLLAASAASAQAPASPPAGPTYNMQKPGEDIGPFAGGAKVHRLPAAKAASHAKPRAGQQQH